MALGGKVNYRVDAMVGDQSDDSRHLANVSLDEEYVFYALKVGAIAGIGQGIEHDDPVPRMGPPPVPDEVRADEAGAASDEKISQLTSIPEGSGGDWLAN